MNERKLGRNVVPEVISLYNYTFNRFGWQDNKKRKTMRLLDRESGVRCNPL
jgi:hypothetical protein